MLVDEEVDDSVLSQKPVDARKVAAYIRWSTEDQGDGHTLEVQRDNCQRVFRESGWTWGETRVYVDAGYSGASMDRPALKRLRDDINERRIECVVVYRLDRLSRKTSDTLSLIQDEWYGICHFVSATEPINTINGTADIVLPLLSAVGEMDRNRIVANTRAGKYEAAKKGRHPGGPIPYGYSTNAGTKMKVIDESEAPIIARIFREYVNGHGLLAVAEALNRDGVAAPKGGLWTQRTIGIILDNDAYAGRQIYGRRIVNPRKRRNKGEVRLLKGDNPVVIENAIPAIIDAATFATVRRLRSFRADKHNARRSLASTYLLSGLTRCTNCGSTVAGSASGPGRSAFYICVGRKHRKTDCDFRQILKSEFEDIVVNAVRNEFNVENRERLVDHALVRLDAGIAEARALAAETTAKLASLRNVKARYIAAFESGALEPAQLKERLDELMSEERQATDAHRAAGGAIRLAESESARGDIEALLVLARELDAWDEADVSQRKHLLRQFVHSIRVYSAPTGDKRLEIVYQTDDPKRLMND